MWWENFVPAVSLSESRLRNTSASERYSRFSRINAKTMTGNRMTTTHAPSVNFTTAKMSTTISEVTPAATLTATFGRHRLPWPLLKCLAIPNPAMVNPVKTPIAYSGTRASSLLSVETIRTRATAVSTMMALENTRRCPRLRSCRGRKASSATKLARNGNPLKLVFAPV